MALPSSAPISLNDIAGEFGGTTPYSLTDYFGSGGAPGSAPISITDFLGLSALPDVNIDAGEWSASFFASQGWTNETIGTQTSGNFHAGDRLEVGRTYDSNNKVVTYGFRIIENTVNLDSGTYKLRANCLNPFASGINQDVTMSITIKETSGSTIENNNFTNPTGWKETEFTLSSNQDVVLSVSTGSSSDAYGVDVRNLRLVSS